MKLVYAREAVADLVRLRHFIATHDPGAAQRVGRELVRRIEHLRRFPEMGARVERAREPADIRDMVFGNYVVRYSIHARAIAILRVWHHFEERSR
ncbi:MAG TPA: type II toxin-antitoxin system RelE/ParE family toxin [Rhodanobacteraceae bacterium]